MNLHFKPVVTALLLGFACSCGWAEEVHGPATMPARPRILISTDIGGTDPDDNQSMMHYLLYSNQFDCEGLVSSPSYGDGNKSEIIRMVGLYEKDLPVLQTKAEGWPSPDYLRSIAKQGRHGAAPMCGYSTPTEGSDWIVKCAKTADERPLYVLVWGGLDDVAQALHDAPEIAPKLRIHWIGGPNKKWSLPSYCYIVENFPNLVYREQRVVPRLHRQLQGQGTLPHGLLRGIREGSGTSRRRLLQLQGGTAETGRHTHPALHDGRRPGKAGARVVGRTVREDCLQLQTHLHPSHDSHGHHTARRHRGVALQGTEAEEGPLPRSEGAVVIGSGERSGLPHRRQAEMARLLPRQGQVHVPLRHVQDGRKKLHHRGGHRGLPHPSGQFFVENVFPGKHRDSDYKLGATWWGDLSAPASYSAREKCQGAETTAKWRDQVMEDWGQRCAWLR